MLSDWVLLIKGNPSLITIISVLDFELHAKQKYFFFITVFLLTSHSLISQPNWRFGLEYNEIGAWTQPYHEQLLQKLEKLGTHGAVNVNGVGSWSSMQSEPSAQIDFRQSDSIVALFQRHGFQLSWYFRCDAAWAFPSKQIPLFQTAAPDPQFEQHWKNYVKAVVERYDGDGINDMPGLKIPIQFYINIGEIKFGKTGKGDDEVGPFWADNIDNLLRLHEITFQAVREADPTGNSKVVSSGALLWDLYADFPDYPDYLPDDTNSVVQQRLRGNNYRGGKYFAGMDSLKKMLRGFGDSTKGKKCDYIGWHPHFNWRVIDQEFKFIHANAGNIPIYVDDMWCNLFTVGYALGALIPGDALITADKFAPKNTKWVSAINGDFPNMLFTTLDPYAELFQKINAGDAEITNWYYATGARRLIKSFASAFGEGAERVSFSQTNDLLRGNEIGWINLLGTRQENYVEKPQFYTYKLLIEKLHDFTSVNKITVSTNPRTRIYRFERPRGPIYIAWSEASDAPQNLNYKIPTGEQISFPIESDSLLITFPITKQLETIPSTETKTTSNNFLTMQLGYEPIFIEPILHTVNVEHDRNAVHAFELGQNYPNPFTDFSTIILPLLLGEGRVGDSPWRGEVSLKIYDIFGREVLDLSDQLIHNSSIVIRNSDLSSPGMYFYRLITPQKSQTRSMIVLR